MYKRITAFLLALCMLLCGAPVYAGASTGATVTAQDVTVTAGNLAYVTVRAENFTDVASLDVFLYYDASALTLRGNYTGGMLSGAQTSFNTKEAGTVKLSAISLDGINGTGDLFTVYFSVSSDCTPGTYPITLAIGDAYDTSLAPYTIGTAKGSVTINKPVNTQTYSVFGSLSTSTVRMGETLTYAVRSGNSSRTFVSADYTFTYDSDLFSVESVELNSAMTGETAVYSVNTNLHGQVRITYANTEAVSAYNLATFTLKAIADVDTTSEFSFAAANVYREDLTMYLPGATSSVVTIEKIPQEIDYPNAFFRTEPLITGRESTSTFVLEAGATVGAADFVLRYDTEVFACVSVSAAEGSAGMVVINDNFADGEIRFSYVNTEADGEAEMPLVTVTWKPLKSPDTHYSLTAEGNKVVDLDFNAVTLEYVPDTGCIYEIDVVEPWCESEGYTGFYCTCGEGYKEDIVDPLGHDVQPVAGMEPTCTEIGWSAHEACIRCGYGRATDIEIPALGHDLTYYEAQTVSCTEIGWDAYEVCSRCDHNTYAEQTPLGHRFLRDDARNVLTWENDAAYPFSYSDGYYTSSNMVHGSHSVFTITAVSDATFDITYNVSSEANYDKILIVHNGSTLVADSGSKNGITVSLQVVKGDVITVSYTKDGSQSTGYDRCQFKFAALTEAPAEEAEATCAGDVTCVGCGMLIFEALPHSMSHVEGKEATCLESGWLSYDVCDVCSTMEPANVVLSPLGHNLTYVSAKTPTCEEDGWKAYEYCGRCDHTTFEVVSAWGHFVAMEEAVDSTNDEIYPFDFNEGIYSSTNKDNSSRSEFLVTMLKNCTLQIRYWTSSEANFDKLLIYHNDSEIRNVSGITEWSALSLEVVAGDTVKFVYTKDGSAQNGEDTVKFQFAPCSDQDVSDMEVTCASGIHCYFCGETLKEALPHTTVTTEGKAPTCTEPGVTEEIYCTACQQYISQAVEIPALGHDLVNHEAQEAGCSTIGWTAYDTCSRCDYTTYEEIPALGHELIHHEAKAETCTEIGWTAYDTCNRCDYTTYEELPALGHDLIHHEAKAETCTESGWTAYDTCSRCDYTTYEEISALGHSYNAVITTPTCYSGGFTTYTCSVCGDSCVADETEVVPHEYQNHICVFCDLAEEGSGAGSAAIMQAGQMICAYGTFAKAVENAAMMENVVICLLTDVREDTVVDGDIWLDLNGHTISGISVMGTVYGMDSATNGYVNNAGTLILDSGTVAAHVKTTSEQAGAVRRYLAIPEGENTWSFHRFYVGVTHVALHTEAAGFGYRAAFAGDDAVKAYLDEDCGFGLVLSTEGVPTALSTGTYAGFPVEQFATEGKAVSKRILLRGILKGDVTEEENIVRSVTMISACGFLKTRDGQIIFSSDVSYSLQQIAERIDVDYANYTELQKVNLQKFCMNFSSATADWYLPNIRKDLEEQ